MAGMNICGGALNGSAPPGQYTFPFSFRLPDNCPASCYYTSGQDAVGIVKYSVKATLQPMPGSNVERMQYKTRLIVRQTPRIIEENRLEMSNININTCCCCLSAG